MNTIAQDVGLKIRLYRKQLNMTIEDLATIICKSKSTVAKYEAGSVALDIFTLNDIADAFNINVYQLLLFPKKQRNANRQDMMTRPFSDCDEFFLYYFDGRGNEIVKSYLRTLYDKNTQIYKAFYYLGLKNYANYSDCDFIYEGTMDSHDFITHFSLTNLVNPVDVMNICILNPLHQNTQTWGILSGVLGNPIAPYSTKVLVSKHMIADSILKNQNLILTKEEFKRIRKYNLIYLNNEK